MLCYCGLTTRRPCFSELDAHEEVGVCVPGLPRGFGKVTAVSGSQGHVVFQKNEFIFLVSGLKNSDVKYYLGTELFFCLNGSIYHCFSGDLPCLVEERNIFSF